MKKISLALLAFLSIGILSCNKEFEPVTPDNNNEPQLVQMTFIASTVSTKTAIGALSGDSYPVTWTEGDQIRVIACDNSDNELATAVFDIDPSGVGNSSAIFTGSFDSSAISNATAYYAVYPATLSATVSSGVISITNYRVDDHKVKAVLNGFDKSRAAMVAAAEGNALSFMHAVAFFKITIAPTDIKSVKFSIDDKNESSRIWGNPMVTLSNGTAPNIANGKKDENYIILEAEDGSLSQNGVYYIPFAVKSDKLKNESSFSITYTNTSGVSVKKKTNKLFGTGFNLGYVYDLGTPPVDFSTDPVLTIKTASIDDVTATATSGLTESGAYAVKNCSDTDVAVTFDGTVVTAASISGGTVTYSVSENTGDARQGWIGLQLTGSELQKITVNQVAAGTATELVPITATTTWSETNWAEMKAKKGTSAVKEDLLFDNIQFINGDGSGIKFNDTYAQLAGSGSTSKCCLQFKVASAGTVEITCKSGNSSNDRTLKVAVGSTVNDISAPGASQNTGTVNVSDAGTVYIYSGGSGINIFTIKWTPE